MVVIILSMIRYPKTHKKRITMQIMIYATRNDITEVLNNAQQQCPYEFITLEKKDTTKNVTRYGLVLI